MRRQGRDASFAAEQRRDPTADIRHPGAELFPFDAKHPDRFEASRQPGKVLQRLRILQVSSGRSVASKHPITFGVVSTPSKLIKGEEGWRGE